MGVAIVAMTGLWPLLFFAAFAAVLLFVVLAPIALVAFFLARTLGFGSRRDDWTNRGRRASGAGVRMRVAVEAHHGGVASMQEMPTTREGGVAQEGAIRGSNESARTVDLDAAAPQEGAGSATADAAHLGGVNQRR
jgi:uncharacterized protein (DUF58 family)